MAKAKPRRPAPKPTPPPKKPIGKWLLYGVVGIAVVSLVVFLSIPPEEIPDGIPEGTQAVTLDDPTHVEGPIDYGVAVPAGGPHNSIPLDCGIYEVEVPQENTVHSLEHGAVWITYQPEIGSDAIGTLTSVARTRNKAILSPVAAQTSPIMATAWGWQLELTDPDDIRLRQFILAFESASTAPEPGAACVGGVAPHGA
jgi:hypothetical protein